MARRAHKSSEPVLPPSIIGVGVDQHLHSYCNGHIVRILCNISLKQVYLPLRHLHAFVCCASDS
jgi:hypothetical protein